MLARDLFGRRQGHLHAGYIGMCTAVGSYQLCMGVSVLYLLSLQLCRCDSTSPDWGPTPLGVLLL